MQQFIGTALFGVLEGQEAKPRRIYGEENTNIN